MATEQQIKKWVEFYQKNGLKFDYNNDVKNYTLYKNGNEVIDYIKYIITQAFIKNLNDLGLKYKDKFNFRSGDFLYFNQGSNYNDLSQEIKDKIIKLANMYGYTEFTYVKDAAKFAPKDWSNLVITSEIEEEIKKQIEEIEKSQSQIKKS